ncbi:MAG TPA: ATP-binding protein [Spirochaetota bacterium]|nr:ATP-binding protein [Spirochaetota bacterium]HRZ26752.1 ATP-binding protein [Spirochaetota bacterium]
MNKGLPPIPYDRMKDQIEKEISSFMEKSGQWDQGMMPAVSYEQGATKISFILPSLTDRGLIEFLGVIKSHIANVRVHSFEDGYYAFQALNQNMFSTENMLDNIKFEFFSLSSSSRAEITKKGELSQEEVNVCIEMFRKAHSSQKESPHVRLRKLGASLISANADMTWDYIAGYDEVKRKIRESIVLPLQNPGVYDSIARKTRRVFESNRPRAVLFEGSPGVGKTTAARVIAGEVDIPLVYVPVESIMSKWYGQSSQNLSGIFDACEDMGGAIIFLDEIDSLAGSRNQNMFEATRRVLSVLLRRLDGIDAAMKTVTIGATNRKEDLDSALISRFDQTILFPLPNSAERASIFSNYAMHLGPEECALLGERSDGMSGRTIKDLCEFAERRWARKIMAKSLEPSAPPIEYYRHSLRVWKDNQ